MPELLRLRPFQREAVDAVEEAHAGGMDYPAVVLPTGAGKTVIMAHLIKEHLDTGNTRAMVLVHRDELCDQTIKALRDVAPRLEIGKVKAADDEVYADVVVASVQTASLPNRLAALVASEMAPAIDHRPFGLVITDECHMAVAPSYLRIYRAFPEAVRAGFTATLARADQVGLGSVIDDVVYTKSLLWMIKNGYLVDLRGIQVTAEGLNLRAVSRNGNDYSDRSLGEAMIESDAGRVIARAYLEHAHDRPGIVFTPTVAAAYDVADKLRALRITAGVVDAATARPDRRALYEDSRTGRVQVIVNCGVLTHGADFPWISCVVPKITKSAGLFQQMAGRGTRLYPGKTDSLILMVGGTGGRMRTLIDLSPGEVEEVMHGESLTEAVDREEAAGNERTPGAAAAFRIRHREADLFAASRSAWLRTVGGVYFIPVADGEVFLWPGREGAWQVRHAPRVTARLKLRWPVLHDGMSLEMAMAWGEAEAEDRDTGSGPYNVRRADRAAAWRKRKDPPSPTQRGACARWMIDIPQGATRAQVNDLLSVHHASMKFDGFAARLARPKENA